MATHHDAQKGLGGRREEGIEDPNASGKWHLGQGQRNGARYLMSEISLGESASLWQASPAACAESVFPPPALLDRSNCKRLGCCKLPSQPQGSLLRVWRRDLPPAQEAIPSYPLFLTHTPPCASRSAHLVWPDHAHREDARQLL